MNEQQLRLRLVYHGRVQGVGFRYTTDRIARGYPVIGSVRNQSDGTVELIVAGDSSQVRAFLTAVADAFDGNIADAEEELLDAATPVGDSFSIRY